MVIFDTARFVRKLTDSGVPENQAVAHCYALLDALREIDEAKARDGSGSPLTNKYRHSFLALHLIIGALVVIELARFVKLYL